MSKARDEDARRDEAALAAVLVAAASREPAEPSEPLKARLYADVEGFFGRAPAGRRPGVKVDTKPTTTSGAEVIVLKAPARTRGLPWYGWAGLAAAAAGLMFVVRAATWSPSSAGGARNGGFAPTETGSGMTLDLFEDGSIRMRGFAPLSSGQMYAVWRVDEVGRASRSATFTTDGTLTLGDRAPTANVRLVVSREQEGAPSATNLERLTTLPVVVRRGGP
jgi:hypothetical protein